MSLWVVFMGLYGWLAELGVLVMCGWSSGGGVMCWGCGLVWCSLGLLQCRGGGWGLCGGGISVGVCWVYLVEGDVDGWWQGSIWSFGGGLVGCGG